MSQCSTKIICDQAYKNAQLLRNGDIYFCCPLWSQYPIGNIKEQTFSEMWNGERAREFRRQFVNNDFKYCHTDVCIRNENLGDFEYPPKTDIAPRPEIFIFNYDDICNVRCIFCKDKRLKETDRFDYFEDNMDELLGDMLQGVKTVVPSTAGEALFSPATLKLIKKINEKFPDIKYSFTTNGLCMTEKNLSRLGILEKINNISMSVHATTKETYDRLVEYSNFDKIKENLKFFSSLKSSGKLEHFQMNFVINAYNYKEMPAFVRWGQELGADVNFLYMFYSGINMEKYKELNVLDKSHPEYNDLCEVIKNPVFKSDNCNIPNEVLNLKKAQ